MATPVLTALPGEIRGYVGPAGQQIHLRQQGEGAPLILLHQALWSSIHYHRLMPLLAQMQVRAIAPDLPGHGMSSPLPGVADIPAYAEAVVRLMDGLQLDRVMVAGHHGGALVAGRLAAAFPDRVSRVVFDTAPMFTPAEREALQAREPISRRIEANGSHFTDRWNAVRLRGDPAWSDATVHIGVTTFFHNGPWREDGFDAAFSHDFLPDVAQISCPVLAAYGRTDPLFQHRERLKAARPDFLYAEFPGAAGMILEQPADWLAVVAGFLTGAGSPASAA